VHVTFATAALCLVLGLAVDDDASQSTRDPLIIVAPSPDAVAPNEAAPKEAVNFDALPMPPVVSDDARVKRFLGALAGGVVGFGVTTALMPLGDAGCFGGAGCVSTGQMVLGIAAPIVSMLGAWLGYQIAGGEGGLLTSMVAMVPAVLLALVFSNLANSAGVDTMRALMPFYIASGAILVGAAALALDLRAQQLGRLGRAASWGGASAGRVTVTSLVGALTLGAAAGATVLVAALCRDAACVVLDVVLGAAGLLGAAAATWGTHTAMGGRGSFLASFAGFGIGALATLAAVGLYAGSQSFGFGGNSIDSIRSTGGAILAVELGTISALFLPALALEWSHTNAIEESLPRFTVGAAPTNGGGMVAAAMRF
jgi:hypothetical protein